MTVKPEPLKLWSPGLASGDWFRGICEWGGEVWKAQVSWGQIPSLPPCSLPPVPPEVTMSCHSATCLVQPLAFAPAPYPSLEGGLGTR